MALVVVVVVDVLVADFLFRSRPSHTNLAFSAPPFVVLTRRSFSIKLNESSNRSLPI